MIAAVTRVENPVFPYRRRLFVQGHVAHQIFLAIAFGKNLYDQNRLNLLPAPYLGRPSRRKAAKSSQIGLRTSRLPPAGNENSRARSDIVNHVTAKVSVSAEPVVDPF